MKVLMITGSFPPMRCGVGDYTHQLVAALARDPQLQVAVLTSKAAASSRPPAELAFFPVIETWDCHEIRKVLQVIRAWSPDLVHIQYPTLGYGNGRLPWLLPILLRLLRLPVVQTWHEIYTTKYLLTSRRLLRFLSKAVVPGGLVVVRSGYQRSTEGVLRWVFLNKAVRFIPSASVLPTMTLSTTERDALRVRYSRPNAHMIAYFGFIYPRKRVELLFQVADADSSHIVIVGDSFSNADLQSFSPANRAALPSYYQSIRRLAESAVWRGKVTMSGFLPADEAARVMAAADAVVLPVLGGGEGWNTSVHAAQAQGTFVLTTSRQRRGYDPRENTYFSAEHDVQEMRSALGQYIGTRSAGHGATERAWQSICESHIELYRTLFSPNANKLS